MAEKKQSLKQAKISKIAEARKLTRAKITTFIVNDPFDDGTFLYNGHVTQHFQAVLHESHMLNTFIYFHVCEKTTH